MEFVIICMLVSVGKLSPFWDWIALICFLVNFLRIQYVQSVSFQVSYGIYPLLFPDQHRFWRKCYIKIFESMPHMKCISSSMLPTIYHQFILNASYHHSFALPTLSVITSISCNSIMVASLELPLSFLRTHERWSLFGRIWYWSQWKIVDFMQLKQE